MATPRRTSRFRSGRKHKLEPIAEEATPEFQRDVKARNYAAWPKFSPIPDATPPTVDFADVPEIRLWATAGGRDHQRSVIRHRRARLGLVRRHLVPASRQTADAATHYEFFGDEDVSAAGMADYSRPRRILRYRASSACRSWQKLCGSWTTRDRRKAQSVGPKAKACGGWRSTRRSGAISRLKRSGNGRPTKCARAIN